MQNAIDTTHRITNAVKGFRRVAILASVCGFALAAAMAPISVDDGGFVLKSALAAGGNGNGKGNGNGRAGAPGQQPAELGDSTATGESDAESALSDSGEQDATPDELPVAEDTPANVRVIREIAGLTEASELSEEEELEAIRNGWDTWRTADGPQSVITQ